MQVFVFGNNKVFWAFCPFVWILAMPIYEYRCENCEHELDALQSINEARLTDCPECGKATLKKKVSAPGFRLKGGGWYETDFKGKDDKKRNLGTSDSTSGDKEASKEGSKKSGGDSGSGSGSSTESKSSDSSKSGSSSAKPSSATSTNSTK